jgi:glycosyltransferase involved in cell wall biosynthesis
MFLSNFLVTELNKYLIKLSLRDVALHNSVAIVATCLWEPYIEKGDHSLICYDYMDDIEIFHHKNNEIEKRHANLIEKSDLVFVTAEKLHEEVASLGHKNIVDVSNGVDYSYFNNIKHKVQLDVSNRKKVGYVGALYKWVDMDIVLNVAKKLPDIDFILVGPLGDKYEHYTKMNYNNISFIGVVPYELVPAYINLFDVAIIPFRPGSIAESTDPIKLYEYFSLGKPVVSTIMRQLIKYANDELMICTNDASEFASAISYFLYKDSSQNKNKRIKIAKNNSWNAKAMTMLESIKLLMDKQ